VKSSKDYAKEHEVFELPTSLTRSEAEKIGVSEISCCLVFTRKERNQWMI